MPARQEERPYGSLGTVGIAERPVLTSKYKMLLVLMMYVLSDIASSCVLDEMRPQSHVILDHSDS